MSFTENLKETIELISLGFERETISNNQENLLKIQGLYQNNPSQFLEMIQAAQMNFHTLVENVMNIPESERTYIFEHISSGLYKHFHTQRLEKLEGFACSYDKSSYIEEMTIQALIKKENLSLFADYTNIKQIKKDKERQAYWSPKTVQDTNEAMDLFWDWYQYSE